MPLQKDAGTVSFIPIPSQTPAWQLAYAHGAVAVGDDVGSVSRLHWPDQSASSPLLAFATSPWLDGRMCRGLTWLAGTSLLAAASTQGVAIGEPTTGQRIAQLPVPDCLLASLTVDVATTVLFMLSGNQHLYFACIQQTDDGWRCSAHHRLFGTLNMARIECMCIADEVLYLGGSGILAFDLKTWRQRWEGQDMEAKHHVGFA